MRMSVDVLSLGTVAFEYTPVGFLQAAMLDCTQLVGMNAVRQSNFVDYTERGQKQKQQ